MKDNYKMLIFTNTYDENGILKVNIEYYARSITLSAY